MRTGRGKEGRGYLWELNMAELGEVGVPPPLLHPLRASRSSASFGGGITVFYFYFFAFFQKFWYFIPSNYPSYRSLQGKFASLLAHTQTNNFIPPPGA